MSVFKQACTATGKTFEILAEDREMLQRFKASLPRLSAHERQRRMLACRNERTLYKRRSDYGGETVVSLFREDMPFPVYTQEEWWSDDCNAMELGRPFGYSRSFFLNLWTCIMKLPRCA